ncbi:hypothetical protein KYJ26_11605 [Bacillus sp. MCCB 382]|uniref:hypothetical protein n=1 Tax=Bacillus sp. MCCB 382 TaxID=2860197 RepID=UPI001C56E3FD|nr:hypothetical protein [Bacillus sp. MCCB 382]
MMFFKKDERINKKSVDAAILSTFIFWGMTLLINALFEVTTNKPLISSSFVMLSAGLLIFYSTEQIANYLHKRKE